MKHLIAVFTLLLPSVLFAEKVPSFRQDVMPVLFRAGCNAGTCHGAAKGQDGLAITYDLDLDMTGAADQALNK
jgi:hypothetical protein